MAQDISKQIAQAETRLFFAIKNQPVLVPKVVLEESEMIKSNAFADALDFQNSDIENVRSVIKSQKSSIVDKSNTFLGSKVLVH